jgi:hypothetical protein
MKHCSQFQCGHTADTIGFAKERIHASAEKNLDLI